MRNQNVLRILVMVLAIAMMLSVASCDLFGKPAENTTPEVTTPEVTTPEVTTPEPTTPEHQHTEEVVPGKAATCTETGLTEGKVCSECGETLVAQEIIPVVAHTEEVVAGKAATCTETGLTEGKKCSVCGEVLVAQETIPVLAHTYVDGVCSVCGAPEVPPCETHSYDVDALTNPARFEKTWGVCTVCGYIDDNHTHKIEAGKCVYCDYEFSTSDVTSKFDADGDGAADVYKFSAALPEKFNDAIRLDAFKDSTGSHMEYDEIRAGSGKLPYAHVYCSDGVATDSITFTLTVEKAGIYEVAVHIRLKDQKERGATFVINEGTENEQVIPATYSWATADEAILNRNNDFLVSAYYTGLRFNLQKGENTIAIKVAEGVTKSQHFRDLYLVLAEAAPEAITVDEAIEIGMAGTQHTGTGNAPEELWSEDWYDVTLTANGDANATSGFFRAYAADGTTQIAVASLTLAEGQTMPKAGDTIVVRAKIGRIATGEVRLYGATIVG